MRARAKRLTLFAALGSVLVAGGAARAADWTSQFGSPDADLGLALARADDGSSYVVGTTFGALPGQSSAGRSDAFISRYDAGGTVVWTRQFGSSERDEALGVTIDGNAVYVVGTAGAALPGQVSAGFADAYIRRYDTSGNEVWTRQFGTPTLDGLNAVAVDGAGNVSVAGFTQGTLPGQSSSGLQDAFVRCFLPSGVTAWTRQFGTAESDVGLGVTADLNGFVTVSGMVSGTLPGQSSSGSWDGFLRRYSSAGTETWTRQFGTSGIDAAHEVDSDQAGNLAVSGFVEGTLPGQTSSGGQDAFVRRYASNGSETWTRQFGTPAYDGAYSVTMDQSGNVYAAGETQGSLPGQTASGEADAFVVRLTGAGAPVWTRQFGTSAADVAWGVAADASSVLLSGFTEGALPGQTSGGLADAFVQRWTPKSCIDTANPEGAEAGPVSGPVHGLEPSIPDPGLRSTAHELNCTVIDPLGL